MKTQEEFFLANQVDGQLTDVQTMQMLDLPEGDTTAKPEDSNVPAVAATAEPVAKVDVAKVEAEPVIVAKDGIHTIPYEKLAEAREGERVAKAQLVDLAQQLEALKSATPAQAVAAAQAANPAATPEEIAALFGDFSEEAIAQGVEKLVAARTAAIEASFDAKLAAALEPLQQKHAESATETHFSAINKAHPDVESVVPSQEFANWINAQPSVVRGSLKTAIEQGTAPEVIEVLDAYKAATGKTAASTVKTDVAAAAQAAIAKAKSAAPMSLSEIPAGSSAKTDEVSAMLEMSSMGLMEKFDGKTPEQIMALMNRIL